MIRKGKGVGVRPMGTRYEHHKSVEKALIMALYFAVIASGAVALGAQVLIE